MKYYICLQCGELTTSECLDENIKYGGHDMCYCMFSEKQWVPSRHEFDIVHFREYYEFTEIPKDVYDGLMTEDNTIKRLRMLRTVPERDLKCD